MPEIEGSSIRPKLQVHRVQLPEALVVSVSDGHSILCNFTFRNTSEYVLVAQFESKFFTLLNELEKALEAPSATTSGVESHAPGANLGRC